MTPPRAGRGSVKWFPPMVSVVRKAALPNSGGDSARQRVAMEIENRQFDEVAQLWWDGAGEFVSVEVDLRQTFKSPSSEGMEPLSLLPPRLRTDSLMRLLNSGGMGPVSSLPLR